MTIATFAAATAAQQPAAPVEDAARALIVAQTQGLPGEVAIEIGELDAHNRLPPCPAPVAFLPAGARAWGAFSVGVRCEMPVSWSVYLQARVEVFADYLVTARPVRAGQILGGDDLAARHGDIAALPADTLTDAAQALGHHARYALAANRPLQRRMLRVPPAVKQGATVTVSGGGQGFQITNRGRALNAASPGEAVRVRLPNNTVVSGVARDDGTVLIGD